EDLSLPSKDLLPLCEDEQLFSEDEQLFSEDEQLSSVDEQRPNLDEQRPNLDEQLSGMDEQLPSEDVQLSSEEAPPPSKEVPPPNEDTSPLGEDVSFPSKGVLTPTEDMPLSSEDFPLPSKDTPFPSEDAPLPSEDEQLPSEDVSPSSENIPPVSEDFLTTINEDISPKWEDSPPIDEDISPLSEDIQPSSEQQSANNHRVRKRKLESVQEGPDELHPRKTATKQRPSTVLTDQDRRQVEQRLKASMVQYESISTHVGFLAEDTRDANTRPETHWKETAATYGGDFEEIDRRQTELFARNITIEIGRALQDTGHSLIQSLQAQPQQPLSNEKNQQRSYLEQSLLLALQQQQQMMQQLDQHRQVRMDLQKSKDTLNMLKRLHQQLNDQLQNPPENQTQHLEDQPQDHMRQETQDSIPGESQKSREEMIRELEEQLAVNRTVDVPQEGIYKMIPKTAPFHLHWKEWFYGVDGHPSIWRLDRFRQYDWRRIPGNRSASNALAC
ncbi:hypothetical protein BGX27_004287, partial [Mortierella sp. AM989]